MKRPSYTLETSQQTYEYHRQFKPNKTFARTAFWLINAIMRPQVEYAPGTKTALDHYVDNNDPLLLPITHLSNIHDQWTAAAVAHQAIPNKVGATRVLAKDAFYNGQLLAQFGAPKALQPAVTSFVNHMGTIPASRARNHQDSTELVQVANEHMFDALGELQQEGVAVALYPEGTHNYTDPKTVQPIRPGIAHIAMRSFTPGNRPAVIVPIGTSYGPDYIPIDELQAKPRSVRRSQVYIGTPTELEPGMTAEEIIDITQLGLQDAADHAHAGYQQRLTS